MIIIIKLGNNENSFFLIIFYFILIFNFLILLTII